MFSMWNNCHLHDTPRIFRYLVRYIWNTDVLRAVYLYIDDQKHEITLVSTVLFNSTSSLVGTYEYTKKLQMSTLKEINLARLIEKSDLSDVLPLFDDRSRRRRRRNSTGDARYCILCESRRTYTVLRVAHRFRLRFKNKWIIEIPSDPARRRRINGRACTP